MPNSAGRVSLAPPFTVTPGTFNAALLSDVLDPSFRITGAAENPAGRDGGGGGTSRIFAGFSPTIAIVVSAGGVWAARIAGASAETAGVPRSSGRLGGATKVFGSATCTSARGPETSGAAGSNTGLPSTLFAEGGTKSLGRGRRLTAGSGRALASTAICRASGASGKVSEACRAMRRSGGGTKALGAGLESLGSIGSGLASSFASTPGGSARFGGSGSRRISGGATNGRTTFGGATAIKFGKATGFGAGTGGSGA